MARRGAMLMALATLTALTGCNNAPTQSPDVTLRQAGVALEQVSGYHVRWSVKADGASEIYIDIDVRAPGAATGTIQDSGTVGEIRYDAKGTFIRGNGFLQRYLNGRVAPAQIAQLGETWIRDDPSGLVPALMALLSTPATIADCLAAHGALKVTGTQSANGQDLAVIDDAGGTIDQAPMTYEIAASGPPFPLRIMQIKPSNGPRDACHFGPGTTLAFSHFGRRPDIVPPKN